MREMIDVLVVGGGPVGHTMAAELHRHGVRCRAVDKLHGPQVWSKAAAVSSRTMEVLQDMGIVDRALAKGRPVFGARIRSGTEQIASLDFRGASATTTPYPYLFGLSQRQMELLLAEHLASFDGAKVERLVELVAFTQDEEGVDATLRHEDGREEKVRARYLVGCDGARSTVRKILDLPFEGTTFEQTLIQADVRIDFPFEVDPNEAQMFISERGPIGALPILDEGRYRLIVLGVPDPPAEPPLSMFEALAAERCPAGLRVYDPAWTVAFRFHGRIVPTYRKGRVFLAGDAGHIHSPVGGQGMNLGMQDAYNLAWKLALVVRGRGKELLLDSYDVERHPIGQEIVDATDVTTKRMMRLLTLRSSLAVAMRNQIVSMLTSLDVFRQVFFRAVSGVNVAYPTSPIIGEHHSSIWTSEVGPGRRDERPGLRDWMRFSKGPAPGERVPDYDFHGEEAGTLFELMRGTKHLLFLFDGEAATDAGYQNLSAIARDVDAHYGDLIDTRVVIPRTERPKALAWGGPVLFDVDGSLHEHFCCGSEGLYLVRPDGYVAFRSQPADAATLFSYLATIFHAR